MSSPQSEQDRALLGAVLGRVPSGIFIVTARNAAGDETGMLASWVQQASFEPPIVSVAINRSRYLQQWVQEVPRLCINVVGKDQKEFLKHFGRGFEPGEAAFTGLDTTTTAGGLTALNGAIGYVEGEVTSQVDAGDHMLALVTLTCAGTAGDPVAEEPMVHIRKNGFGY